MQHAWEWLQTHRGFYLLKNLNEKKYMKGVVEIG